MSRLFWFGVLCTVPLVVLTMAEHFLHRPLLPQPAGRTMYFLLATFVVFYSGYPIFARAWASVVNRSPNMFTLIGVGVGAAYLYSVAAFFAPHWFPPGVRLDD